MIYNMVSLQSINNDTELWGGKAVALAQLIEDGCNVPDGFVISTDVYELYVKGKINWDILERELDDFCQKLYETEKCTLIFRSSANIEGNNQIACCGIIDSFIHDNSISLSENVMKVWYSLNSQYAKHYFEHSNVRMETIKMAVIVQKITKAEFSAVIQTYDIINKKDRIVVEYNKGALDIVVNGYEDANLLYIDWNGDIHYSENSIILEDTIVRQLYLNCIQIEKKFNSHMEIEAQIGSDVISYIQARSIK